MYGGHIVHKVHHLKSIVQQVLYAQIHGQRKYVPLETIARLEHMLQTRVLQEVPQYAQQIPVLIRIIVHEERSEFLNPMVHIPYQDVVLIRIARPYVSNSFQVPEKLQLVVQGPYNARQVHTFYHSFLLTS